MAVVRPETFLFFMQGGGAGCIQPERIFVLSLSINCLSAHKSALCCGLKDLHSWLVGQSTTEHNISHKLTRIKHKESTSSPPSSHRPNSMSHGGNQIKLNGKARVHYER